MAWQEPQPQRPRRATRRGLAPCLVLLVLGLLAAPAAAAEVRAFPADYVLVLFTEDGERVLAEGRAFLKLGEPASRTHASTTDDSRTRLQFTLERPREGQERQGKLRFSAEAQIQLDEGTQRVNAGDDSYIEGARLQRVGFEAHSWRAPGDPTPVTWAFSRDGHAFELRVILDTTGLRD